MGHVKKNSIVLPPKNIFCLVFRGLLEVLKICMLWVLYIGIYIYEIFYLVRRDGKTFPFVILDFQRISTRMETILDTTCVPIDLAPELQKQKCDWEEKKEKQGS